MKRTGTARSSRITGLAVALVLGTAGAAFAAAMSLSTGHLGANTIAVGCQDATVTPSWVLTYDPAAPGYMVTGVTLAGLQPGCLDRAVSVVVADSRGAALATGTGRTPRSGRAAQIDFASPYGLTSPWPGQLSVIIYA